MAPGGVEFHVGAGESAHNPLGEAKESEAIRVAARNFPVSDVARAALRSGPMLADAIFCLPEAVDETSPRVSAASGDYRTKKQSRDRLRRRVDHFGAVAPLRRMSRKWLAHLPLETPTLHPSYKTVLQLADARGWNMAGHVGGAANDLFVLPVVQREAAVSFATRLSVGVRVRTPFVLCDRSNRSGQRFAASLPTTAATVFTWFAGVDAVTSSGTIVGAQVSVATGLYFSVFPDPPPSATLASVRGPFMPGT
ncbi:hypothetical protein ASPZODRAFT_16621 [Penicilliopsis zonata CBS 506.65]|uniref:Uncharacterized protein n=1 Tax=Penicilliopsis zonata CBS 506.65 TaxID=1073090 RepID=A0A1L9SFH6_9EURO|nr:hypothetical protein ASPZODRAFT_16621 [Penicilliopsis zonata CBS 506.65]OJJ46025.1 hypothetical protein ASPZODRAFT_16621 [Penicilliopsis zonata CBS 506.65]